jgi:hypothetical protein
VCHALRTQKYIGDLQQNTCAITGQWIGPHRTAMSQVFQNLQTLTHHVMALLALDMGDKAHSTSIALLARIVQTLLDWQTLLHRQRRITHMFPNSSNCKAQTIKPKSLESKNGDTRRHIKIQK